MPQYKTPLRDIRFAINEVLDFPDHYARLPNNSSDASPDLVDAIINEGARFAEEVLSPLNAVGDREGCRWQDGAVSTPPGFADAYRQFVDGGWLSLAQETSWGGQGLPPSLGTVINEMLQSANHAWAMYPTLSLGAIDTIAEHGTDEQKQRFLPNLVAGRWSGTMCLTEAHCGSDLGLLRTKAEPQADGSYRISGSKIFISAGEHDLTENIVHLVLARLPDAPEGIKGISLFLVPKFHVQADGHLGERNTVSCGAIEHKMGIHGNATCVLNFDGATGYLIGPPNKGMHCMFTFINESRLGVAQQGQGHTEAAFQGALNYARERLQMRAPKRIRPDRPADPIIAHPDVRRMLLTQKALAEGGRLLNYYCAQQVDMAHRGTDAATREQAQQRLALLTPIAKGFLTEAGIEAANLGIQVLGGHGYISESGMEQIVRDVRITAIYEGTSGIQGLDLLGRKVLASESELLAPFAAEIEAFCDAGQSRLDEFVQPLRHQVRQWLMLSKQIGDAARDNPDEVGAAAFDYLLYSGYTVLAWCWARSADAAQAALDAGSNDIDFYQAKQQTARFYFHRLLPRAQAHAAAIASGAENLMAMAEEQFAY
ncbi:acyl-CoA dehydrogenase [Halomonas campisalis]|uniref:Acyl-CoA dehydrogenase n=1 Tax=Billgrantia campisalis TaxID=74661 RepID=A0ABS9P5B1_9GAMM|nr:acyl-CoA dehydrogenase C-terminal domain-containing protein [Halomonas campisalis]MCG6656972.1 acyl-CoA dehydrogenase [Halomonas campisalis]MDR5862160.1 acyl-CoA dehydrogenase C-terminal domain-containing protein [Halomonas campisalis]